MDKTLADTLVANIKQAHTAKELAHAQTSALIAIVECQHKTSERVKALVAEAEKRRTVIGVVGSILGGFIALASCGVLGVMWRVAVRVGAV